MLKPFMASLMAAVIAVTSLSAAPVQAGDRDKLGKFLLGAGALVIIGGAIHNANKNRGHSVTRVSPPPHKPYVKPRKKFVPVACLRHNRFNQGPKRFFGQRCLRNNMAGVHRLPGSCLRNVWTKNGHRTVYGARCLRQHGWKFS